MRVATRLVCAYMIDKWPSRHPERCEDTSRRLPARVNAPVVFPCFAKALRLPIGSRLDRLYAIAKETVLSSTFDRVADIIAETSEIDRDKITPESHTIDDLGIDSLDFLDIVFAIDKEFGIKIPLEKWTQRVNEGEANTEEYFVMKNLCAKIDELRAAKGA